MTSEEIHNMLEGQPVNNNSMVMIGYGITAVITAVIGFILGVFAGWYIWG